MRLVLAIVMAFTLALTWTHAQTEGLSAEDIFLANALSQIKKVVTENHLREVAVWKIEPDVRSTLDVEILSTRLNFALMDEGLLSEQAIDLTAIEDQEELERIASIYEIRAFLYGKRTMVDGETIRVSFQLLEASNLALIWEGVVSSEEGLSEDLVAFISYAKWGLLLSGVGAGVGSGVIIGLAIESFNKYPARSDREAAQIYQELTTYAYWGIGLGIASVVSGGISTYLFLTDPGDSSSGGVAFLAPHRGESSGVFLWPQPGGVGASVNLRF